VTTTTIPELDQVRSEVRDHYAQRAQTAGTSCCEPNCGPSNGSDACCGDDSVPLYDSSDLALVPDEMSGMSWGCGNPTAIAALKPGEVVLDLGSGAGLDVMLAARKVGEMGFAYGVDMTDEMLELARRNAAKAGATNVEFRKGHIEDIPLPDQSVDVIISNCVINLSPDKGQTLHEAYRVLRRGGRLAVSDIVVDGTLDDLPVSEAQIRQALSWAGCIAGALTVNQYKSLLIEAGFEEIEVKVKHRYTLEELGQDLGGVAATLPLEVAQQLVGRFTSCDVAARRLN
jgi:ubiquinone/menaquinone biosynthesis C-methylase UbiE